MFLSSIGPSEPIIGESNWMHYCKPEDVEIGGQLMCRGLLPRDYSREPFGSVGVPFDLPVIPRSEWPALIEQQEQNKSRMSDLVRHYSVPPLNQGQTNYCWINAPVMCLQLTFLREGLGFVRLSPASAGGPIKGFRNVGGWGTEGLQWLVEHGCCPVDAWPANAIDRRYYTEENKKLALDYRVHEWVELRPRSFDELATAMLLGFPVAVGYNWWRHEVTALDLVMLGRDRFGCRIYNSWGEGYGEKGMAVLEESKATPDDAVFARSSRRAA